MEGQNTERTRWTDEELDKMFSVFLIVLGNQARRQFRGAVIQCVIFLVAIALIFLFG